MTLEGTQFSHYHILKLIGKGGMGEVYLAEDTQVQRQVAAKFLKIETAQVDHRVVSNALRLFWREATAIAKLDHPSILPLYDHGETEIEGLHLAYLILPYRPEGSLVTWLRKREQTQQTRQLTLKQVAHVIQQASLGLQYAHERAVMHLDVKLANFLIRSRAATDEYSDLQLSDFGIARLASATSSTSQHLRGTPTYMAPEQCKGQPVIASDQYALAIMAYELLTGSPPFHGPPMSVMFAHVHTQPRPVHELNPLLPSAVDIVLQRALAKIPQERFLSVATFAQAFQDALGREEDIPTKAHPMVSTPRLPPPVSAMLIPSHIPQPNPTILASPADPLQDMITLTPAASLARPPAPNAVSLASSTGIAALVEPKRRRFPPLVALALLVGLLFLSGGGFGGYQIVTGIQKGQATARALGALTQAHRTATAQAQATALALATGKVWHAQHSGTPEDLRDVAWSGSLYVAVQGDGTLLTSRDGRAWSTQTAGTNYHVMSSIIWANSQFVAVGEDGIILTSPNGHVWATQQLDASESFSDVVWSGSLFVVVGSKTFDRLYSFDTILTSPDGHTWHTQNPGDQSINEPLDGLSSVAWSGSQFIAVGSSYLKVGGFPETILTSPDGSVWSAQNPGSSYQYLRGVAWSGSQFVAVGGSHPDGSHPDGSIILTSPDGRVWTAQTSFPPHFFSRVVWAGWQFIVVGEDGAILTSPDGRTWTVQHSGTSETLEGVFWSGSHLIVVGWNGTLLTSP